VIACGCVVALLLCLVLTCVALHLARTRKEEQEDAARKSRWEQEEERRQIEIEEEDRERTEQIQEEEEERIKYNALLEKEEAQRAKRRYFLPGRRMFDDTSI
jgi:hypothetical protein